MLRDHRLSPGPCGGRGEVQLVAAVLGSEKMFANEIGNENESLSEKNAIAIVEQKTTTNWNANAWVEMRQTMK